MSAVHSAQPPATDDRVSTATLNLAQASGTYTSLTASGDVLILCIAFLVTAAGGVLTSVSVQNDEATQETYLSASDGALANLQTGKSLPAFDRPATLRSGKRVRYTLTGLLGSGSIMMTVRWRPITANAGLA